MSYGAVKLNPSLVADRRVAKHSPRERVRALFTAWEVLVLFGIVMGSIYLGIATPTEAAAVGALVSFLIAVSCKGGRWALLRDGLRETGTATASIFLLILGAGLFSLGLSTTQLPVRLADWMVGLTDSKYLTLVLILIPYFILGMFIDGISMILLTMPITFPIIVKLGFDPVWFGIIITKTVEIGVLTPPVGLNAFVVKNVSPELTLAEVFRGCLPFVVLEILIVALLAIFPEMTMLGRS